MEKEKKECVTGKLVYKAPGVKVSKVELEGCIAVSYAPSINGNVDYTDYDPQTESSGDVLIF